MFAICLQTKKIENKIVEKPCKIRKSLCKHFCKQYKVGIRANFFIYSNVNGGYFVTEEVKGATPGNQHWVAVTGVNGNNVIMVDPASNQTDMWSAYEWSKSSQFNYFKAE